MREATMKLMPVIVEEERQSGQGRLETMDGFERPLAGQQNFQIRRVLIVFVNLIQVNRSLCTGFQSIREIFSAQATVCSSFCAWQRVALTLPSRVLAESPPDPIFYVSRSSVMH